MPLRRKINDELRFDEASIVEHEHFARHHFPALAGRLVGFRIGGPFALELERDALAHNADRVDGVHYRVDALLQQVARRDLEGHGSLSIIPAGPHLHFGGPPGSRQRGTHPMLCLCSAYADLADCCKRDDLMDEKLRLPDFLATYMLRVSV